MEKKNDRQSPFIINKKKCECLFLAFHWLPHHRFSVSFFFSLAFAFFYSAGNKLTTYASHVAPRTLIGYHPSAETIKRRWEVKYGQWKDMFE